MNLLATVFAIAFPAMAADCAPAPVGNSHQAVCYAMAYAAKNNLPRPKAGKTSVSKGKTVWIVRHISTLEGERGAGWQVEVDVASGTVIRFTGYKGDRQRPL